MIRIDENYSEYRDDTDPGYPGGKAIPVSAGNRTDGTPWRARLFNTIIGFFQAIIVDAYGQLQINGEPDRVGLSDLLTAIKKLMREAVNPQLDSRITANTTRSQNNEYAIGIIEQILLDLVHEAPNDGRIYGRKNKGWIEVSSGGGSGAGTAIEAFKFFSKQSVMFTNARIIDRRARGWDLGIPYLGVSHEVYHFDTDLLNQNQQSNIIIGYTGDAPVLVSAEDQSADLFYNPAVKYEAPFEMKGRSLLGRFSVSAQVSGEACGGEFWARIFLANNITIFRLRSNVDEIVLRIGGSDPGYGTAEDDGISYGINESDGIAYGVPGTSGNTLDHTWQGGSESVNLDDEDIEILDRAWFHIAAVATLDTISLFIGSQKIDFERHSHTPEVFDFEINEEEDEINIDELSLVSGAEIDFEKFSENSAERVPYAALNYKEKWFVLEAQDVSKVKTNLFETDSFKAAVQAVLAEQ
ncbi:MAG: hypothetical protein LBC77_05605 [Spirochaetaceae bacterium]|jgi:hypothetical protein|nr:hypothetical protein [Spirochaetaceae bacterium]